MPKGASSQFDNLRLLPLVLAGDQETWLCTPGELPEGAPTVDSWPVDVDDEISFDEDESVSSVSANCGEFDHLMDVAEWEATKRDVEEVKLLFPVGCSSADMVWLLVGDAEARRAAGGSNVDFLFPAGCTDKDKEWLTRAASLSDMDWLVPAQDAQGTQGLVTQDSF